MNHLLLHFPQKACGDLDKVGEKNTGKVKKKKNAGPGKRKIRVDFKNKEKFRRHI